MNVIELRILGPAELRAADRGELRRVLTQPKRLALFVYLVLAAPGGFVRRDTLLALFWPELDTVRARDALKQAVRFLRQELGAEIVIGRGADEIGVAADAVWCDAVAFSETIASGQYTQALALYRGDLLEGFFSATSATFSDWLERERERRRLAAARAASQLAGACDQNGELTSAIEYARRALDFSASDEQLLRQLLSLLDRAGDRAGAVELYEQFVRRMAAEYDVEPAAETRALIARIRSRAEPRVPAVDADPVVAPRPTRSRHVARFPAHRRLLLGSAALVILVVAILVARSTEAPEKRGPTPDVQRIAVMPFVVRGGAELAHLAEGMVDLLSVDLDGAGEVRAVHPRVLLRRLSAAGGIAALENPDSTARIARDVGADAYVTGSVVQVGDRLRIAAWLHPLGGADADTINAQAEGDHARLPALVDEIAAQLLVGRARGEEAYFARLASATTTRFDALKAYLDGENHWRARRSDSAVAAFRRAVELDSAFGLAYYRIAVAAEWSLSADGGDAIERALAHASRLPPRHRMLLRALQARYDGELARSESAYVAFVRSYPDDPEAWFQLATLRTPQSYPWGKPISEAREAFQRALDLDPEHPRAPGGLSWLDGHDGRHAAAVRHLEQLLERDRGQLGIVIRAALAFARDDRDAQRAAIAELRKVQDTRHILFASDFVAQRVGNEEGGILAARVLTEPSRSPKWRAFGYGKIADIELGRGRHRAAWDALREAHRFAPVFASQARALAALSPFAQVDTSQLADVRREIDSWLPATVHDSIRREHLLGHLSARMGRNEPALGSAVRLESLATELARRRELRAGAMARDVALGLRAHLALREGARAEALALLESWRPEEWWLALPTITKPDPDDVGTMVTGHSYAFERWMRAELLAAAGRTREAISWYEGLGFLTGEDRMYLVPSRLRLAALYEQRGEHQLALEQYRRVARLWQDSDPALRSLHLHAVSQAQRLSRRVGRDAIDAR